jgi:hypothetical protein
MGINYWLKEYWMNKQVRNVLLIGVLILLLTACGQVEATPAPADAPEPTAIENPTSVENISTAVAADGSDPGQFSKYIGLNHPPLPEHLTLVFAMLIEDVDGYALTLFIDGANKMLWLDKRTHYDTDGNAYWEVKDVLDLSNLEAGFTLIPDGCSLNGVRDSEIIVASKDGTTRLAWRADTTLNKFEVIPIQGIECLSDKATDI